MPDAIRIAEAAAPALSDLELAEMLLKEPLQMFERFAYMRELACRIIATGEDNPISNR